ARSKEMIRSSDCPDMYSGVPPAHIKGGVLPRSGCGAEPPSTTLGCTYCPPSSLRRKGAVYLGEAPVRRSEMPRRPASAPAARSDLPERRREEKSNAAPGWSFGTSQRRSFAKTTGQDLYMPPSTLRTRSASCANGHRPDDGNHFEMRPDPQTYDPSVEAKASAPKFGAARRWSSQPQISHLGPGSYSTALEMPVKGVVKMSSTRRFAAKGEDWEPGPGAYDLEPPPQLRTRPTFSRAPRERQKELSGIGGERRAKIIRSFFRASSGPQNSLRRGPRLPPQRVPRKARGEKEPGPGSFDVTAPGHKGSCPFNRSPRWRGGKNKEGPGPGSYRTELGKSTKLGKLAPRPEDAPEDGNPVPGQERSGNGPGPDYKVYTLFPRR
ncbi:unnamed protein product, partial [Effrenium voratum]